MRRFVIRLMLFLLLQGLLASLILPAALSQPRPGYLAALDDKLELVRTVESPRVIFVGGSSVAFGIDSQVFEQGLGQPAINLGLHGALGLDFYLRIVEQHCQPGDMIVLLPEYAMLSDRHMMTTEHMRRLLRNCPSAFRYLTGNRSSGKQFLDTMALSEIGYWTQRGIDVQTRRLRQFSKRHSIVSRPSTRLVRKPSAAADSRDNPSVYRRNSFNSHGDMVGHHGLESLPLEESTASLPWSEDGLRESVQRLNRCAAICRQRGAEVIFSYAPLINDYWSNSQGQIVRLHTILEQSLEMPLVNRPQDTVFPRSEFFDSVNHLSESAQQARSQILLRGLSRELANRSDSSGRRWR